jgi:hypothetical protein
MRTDRLPDILLTLRFESQRLFGVLGLLGVLLLCAAVAVGAAIPGMQSDTRDLVHAVRLARAAKARNAAAERSPVADTPALETLPELFPSFTQSADDIASILTQARNNKLMLGSAEYQVATESNSSFTRYQVLLPVKDQYSAIRRFLAAVLNNVPNAALQEIHVERPTVDGNILEARIRFELIYRIPRP